MKNNINNISKILLDDYNYQDSYKKRICLDKYKNPIPWFTYPAIMYLKQLDLKDKTVFEWGAGNSTLFFAERTKKIISTEYKKDWFEKISKQAENFDNIELRHIIERYEDSIFDYDEKFDIIIIDGEINTRFKCAKNSAKKLKNGGMIILDNSDWLENTSKFIRSLDLIEIDFFGFGPINFYTWCTSIYIHRKYNFKTIKEKQPDFTIGGLKNERD